MLRCAQLWGAVPGPALALTAARHGAELREAGCTVAQVVHHYGDICRTIEEVAMEQHVPVTPAEYQTPFKDDIASTAYLQAFHKGIRLTVESVPAALAINGDSRLLTSALMSVINNAFEFTPRRGPWCSGPTPKASA